MIHGNSRSNNKRHQQPISDQDVRDHVGEGGGNDRGFEACRHVFTRVFACQRL
jgi:hypothetical protein